MERLDPRPRRIAVNLLRWYRAEARDLPWRKDPTPYTVWISEIMLQQTTVGTAAPYFTRFIERFPTVEGLARADEQEVLALWSGLGYYHRARNLLKSARLVVEKHDGAIPFDSEALLALPGVGSYTAAAIQAIGFNKNGVALDANVTRVAARLEAIPGGGAAARRSIETAALRMLPDGHASEFNQALMDLGATICTARDPRCSRCPVAAGCLAKSRGLVHSIPPQARRKATVSVELAALAIRRASGEYLLMPRTGERLMKGMWEFPLISGAGRTDLTAAAGNLGARVVTEIGTVSHTITHHRIRINVYEARIVRGKAAPSRARRAVSEPGAHLATGAAQGNGRWIPLEGIVSGRAGLALTGTARKIARMMTRVSTP